MNAKNPKFAIVPKGKDYVSFKSGDKLEIIRTEKIISLFFDVISPMTGNILNCCEKECSHLNGKNWILRNK